VGRVKEKREVRKRKGEKGKGIELYYKNCAQNENPGSTPEL
jgi:hypothetical protein